MVEDTTVTSLGHRVLPYSQLNFYLIICFHTVLWALPLMCFLLAGLHLKGK